LNSSAGGGAIFKAAAKPDPDDRSTIITNPESYNFFAVASYLARNPPQTPAGSVEKPGVVFFGGLPNAAT
jgi:hypothetical protein